MSVLSMEYIRLSSSNKKTWNIIILRIRLKARRVWSWNWDYNFPETTWFGNRCSSWRPSFVVCYERSPRWGNLKHFLIKYNLKVRFLSSLSINPLSQETGVIHGRGWKAGDRDTDQFKAPSPHLQLKPHVAMGLQSNREPQNCGRGSSLPATSGICEQLHARNQLEDTALWLTMLMRPCMVENLEELKSLGTALVVQW